MSLELAIAVVEQYMEAEDRDDMATSLQAEIRNSSSWIEETAIEIGREAKNEIDQYKQEIQRKRWEKMAKFTCVLFLSLSITILTAAIADSYSSSRSHDELILCKASGIFALISFFAGIGLFISLQFENVQRRTQLGISLVTVISLTAGAFILFMKNII